MNNFTKILFIAMGLMGHAFAMKDLAKDTDVLVQQCQYQLLNNISTNQSLIKYVTLLNLSGYGLTELPEAIGQLQCLHELNLSHNSLCSLPDQ